MPPLRQRRFSFAGFSWSCQTSHGTKLVQMRAATALSIVSAVAVPCRTSRLQHVYDQFGTARVFLQAATKLTGKQWSSRHCFIIISFTCVAERGVAELLGRCLCKEPCLWQELCRAFGDVGMVRKAGCLAA